MFPNLRAEQARRGLKNSEIAVMLGIKTADAYERRLRNGRFLANECLTLCKMFNCSFEYLFETENTDDHRSA